MRAAPAISDTGVNGNAELVNAAGDKDRKANAGFGGSGGDVDLETVGDGRGAGVGVVDVRRL